MSIEHMVIMVLFTTRCYRSSANIVYAKNLVTCQILVRKGFTAGTGSMEE